MLVTAILTAVMLAYWVEMPAYERMCGWISPDLAGTGKIVATYVLSLKTLALLVPFIGFSGVLLWLGFQKTSIGTFLIFWTVVFWWLSADVISMSFSGTHVSDYVPYLWDFVRTRDHNPFQWAGEGLIEQASLLLLVVALAGSICLGAARWLALRVLLAFGYRARGVVASSVTLGFVAFFVVSGPVLGFFSHKNLLDGIRTIAPVDMHFIERSAFWIQSLYEPAPLLRDGDNFIPLRHSEKDLTTKREMVIQNLSDEDLRPGGWRVQDRFGRRVVFQDVLKAGHGLRALVPKEMAEEDWFFVVDSEGWLRHRLNITRERPSPRLVIRSGSIPATMRGRVNIDREEGESVARLLEDAVHPKPVDVSAGTQSAALPDIVVIAVESLRSTALSRVFLDRLKAMSPGMLEAPRHYSGSNISFRGLFTLLYGRSAIGYHQTLDEKIPPQLFELLRRSGYSLSFVSGREFDGSWRRMSDYLNESTFDEIISDPQVRGSWVESFRQWNQSDVWKLSEVARLLREPHQRPRFIFTFLMSSHYPYAFPREFAIHQPCGMDKWQLMTYRTHFPKNQLLNRYRNACLFLEDRFLELASLADLSKTVVVITGDHGESFGEDGVMVHGSKLSEVQLRVPFLMFGPGVLNRTITEPTWHADLVPTLFHLLSAEPSGISNCHGKDLFSDCRRETKIAVSGHKNAEKGDTLLLIDGSTRALMRGLIRGSKAPSLGFADLLDEKGNSVLRANQ